jgi:hypothetical protein
MTLNRSQDDQKLEEIVCVKHTIKANADDAVFAPGDPQRRRHTWKVKWEPVFATRFLNLESPVRAWLDERTVLPLRIEPRLGLLVEVVGMSARPEASVIEICPISFPLVLIDREAFNIILFVTPSSGAHKGTPLGNVKLTFRVPGEFDGTYSWIVKLPALLVRKTRLKVDLDVPPICQRLARQRLQLRITNYGTSPREVKIDISDRDDVAFVIEGFLTANVIIEPQGEYVFEVTFTPIRDHECTFPKISVYEARRGTVRWSSEPRLFVTCRP